LLSLHIFYICFRLKPPVAECFFIMYYFKALSSFFNLTKTAIMDTNQDLINTGLQIDPAGHSYLAETAKWGNFLSIVGFVLSGILALVALFAGTLLGSAGRGFGNSSSMIGAGFVTVIYLVIAALYFFMSLFLNRFSSKMKTALYSNDQETLNNSFLNLKNLYKMMGIITIVYLSILILAFIFGIGSALLLK